MALPLLLLQAELSGGDTEHLIELETSFPKGAMLDMLDVSYARVFIKADMILLCVYAKFRIIYFQMIFNQSFNTILFIKVL